MKEFWKRRGFTLAFSCLLILFTGYALLDTFVIPRRYSSAEPMTAQEAAGEASSSGAIDAELSLHIAEEAAADENSYVDDHISVTVTELREYDTAIYVADVTLSAPEYLKTALACDTYGKNVKAAASEISAGVGAILAVNGDFYGARSDGYVIRNGVLYRAEGSGNEDLVIYADGSFAIIDEDAISAEALLAKGAQQVLSFGPALVEDGEIAVSRTEEVGKAMASNPRTAIGIIGENHYVLVVSDGRTSESEGLSLYELAEVMQRLGVQTAYNLDGGGSSTMVFRGEVVNNPTTGGKTVKERSVSDIVYVGY